MIAVAWALPFAWIAAALLSGPSDGTSLSSSTATTGVERWGERVTVARAYGATPLRAGDVVQAVDGRTISEWLADDGGTTRSVGEVVRYEVRRSAAELPLVLQLDVRLTRYPLAAALSDNLPTVAFTVLLLAAGALTFWRRPESPSARAFLATTALVPMAITAAPCGLGAIDLAGGRGIWPHAGGELWCALGMGTALVTAVTLTGVPDRVRRRPWLLGCRLPRPPGRLRHLGGRDGRQRPAGRRPAAGAPDRRGTRPPGHHPGGAGGDRRPLRPRHRP